MTRRLRIVALASVVGLVTPASFAFAQGADPTEQRRLQLLGTLPREQQLVPATQAWLVGYMRRASSLYLHRLDSLGCQELFSLGDEARFRAAVGAPPGSDYNAVFIEGPKAPSHLPDGPYVFPADTHKVYWPPRPDLDTYWHENQHELLEVADCTIGARPYAASLDEASDTDNHHPFIEGVGQRGAEAYAELIGFEAAVRRADQVESEYIAQGRNAAEYGVQRQLWGDAHQRFSAFVRRMKRVANMPPADLARYRAATGVWFSTVEQVAEWYRGGGLKRQERGEVLPVRPPAWVFFPDLFQMPVQIQLTDAQGRDLELPGAAAAAPSETKGDIFRQTFVVQVRAKGSMARYSANQRQNRVLAAVVARGTLRMKVVEDDPLAGLGVVSVPQGQRVDGKAGPGGPSTQYFEIDLSKAEIQPLRVTFVRRQLSQLKGAKTYHVALEFSDPGKDRLYDTATAQLGFTLGVSSGGAQPSAGAPPPSPPSASQAPTPATPTDPQRGEPLGVKIGWTVPSGVEAVSGGLATGNNAPLPASGELELRSGPSMFFKRGSWAREGGFFLEVYARREDKNMVTLDDYLARTRPKSTHPATVAWFERFKHRETKVGGLRAFESYTSGAQQMNHHWFVELDPQRQLWATFLGDCKVTSKNLDAFPGLVAAMEGTVKSLRFVLDAAPPLTVSRSDAPVPRAFTDTAISDNEIAKRPPPPPPDPGGGRRKPARVASATTAPPPGAHTPAGPGTPPPGSPPPTGRTTPGNTPPPSRPPPGSTTPPPPPHTAPPRGAPPAAVAPPAVPMVGGAVVVPRGKLPAVTLSNTGRTTWTRCTVTIPGRRSWTLKALGPGFRREMPLKYFTADRSAPDLVDEVLVRCAEGTVRYKGRF